MSLEDELRQALVTPAPHRSPLRSPRYHQDGFSFEWDGHEGWIETPPIADRPTTWDAYIRDAGLDPEEVEVVGQVQIRGWDANVGGGVITRLRHYKANVQRRSELLRELPLLFSEARRVRRPPRPDSGAADRVAVVCWADPQTGKVARRGGTTALVSRVGQAMDKLDAYLDRVQPQAAMLFDLGDAIEGFENTSSQMATNDLSLMDQVDLAATLEFQLVNLLAKKTYQVGVAGVGSNHCRWRRGKDQLGTPGDDWGLFLLKQLKKSLAMSESFNHVSVSWPNTWDETMALDVAGHIVGLGHGHWVTRPENIPLWWAKQVHGGQPVAHADILLTGHFHHLRLMPSGRNPWTDRSKWWLQAPTMDNGSDWYRHTAGDDSDPGLVVFTLTRGQTGFPFDDLMIL